MITENFGLITAESTHKIMKLEKFLLEKNLKVRIIPVPKEITANCGISIKFNLSLLKEISSFISEDSEDFSIYLVEKSGFKKNIKKL
jgi:S-ribosylhomocysteine lyase LuxS involved in autoinducer biosynthesis